MVRAIELDETLGLAHARLAVVNWELDHDWSNAEKGLSRALEIEPSSAATMVFYAHLLASAGRHEEALAMPERAVAAAEPVRTFEWDLDAWERAYQSGGLRGSATEMLASYRDAGFTYTLRAQVACLAGRPEDALVELTQNSLEEPMMQMIGTWPAFDCVRSDPRFQDLLRKINWPGLSG